MAKQEVPWWLWQDRVCLQCRRPGFDPWVGKIPWRKKWQPIPVLLPGELHGQRSLASPSLWGCKELDMTEPLMWPKNKDYISEPPLQQGVITWLEFESTDRSGSGMSNFQLLLLNTWMHPSCFSSSLLVMLLYSLGSRLGPYWGW